MSLGSKRSSCSFCISVTLRVYGNRGSWRFALLLSVFCLTWVNGGPVVGTQDLPGVCGFPAVPADIVLFFLRWMILASMSKAVRDMSLVLRPPCFSSVLTCLSFLVSTTSVDYHYFIASLNICSVSLLALPSLLWLILGPLQFHINTRVNMLTYLWIQLGLCHDFGWPLNHMHSLCPWVWGVALLPILPLMFFGSVSIWEVTFYTSFVQFISKYSYSWW